MKNFTFDLMGHPIKVVFDIDTVAGQDLWGEWLPKADTIRLPIETNLGEYRDAFMHELVHAVAEHVGLELPEPAVRCLGLGLGHALADLNVLALVNGEQFKKEDRL